MKTALYETHLKYQAKIVDFHGTLLPIQYNKGIIYEHQAVRQQCGLFDVSHMTEILIEGPDALPALNALITNDISIMKDFSIKYTLLCNEQGNVLDDLLVYKYSDTKLMMVCNAGNHQKDLTWITEHIQGNVRVTDRSSDYSMIAIQGPQTEAILGKLVDISKCPQQYYTFVGELKIGDFPYFISRNGYTGEDGFEIMGCGHAIVELFDKLVEAGAIPCGLGARDTLRLEAGMPLYGHELNESTNPFEAKLGFFVKLSKNNFIGKDALKDKPRQKTLVGLKMIDRGIGREGSLLYDGDQEIGVITSGTHLPTCGFAGAMAYVNLDHPQTLDVDVRGRRLKAEVISLPFYKRK